MAPLQAWVRERLEAPNCLIQWQIAGLNDNKSCSVSKKLVHFKNSFKYSDIDLNITATHVNELRVKGLLVSF